MDPVQLLAPSNALGNPAPFWFLELFKVLGFTLHLVPMNLWFAGMIFIATVGIFGKGMNKIAANRLANAMPVIVALGINFGIVPLLFLQVAYHKFYFASSIMMAAPWLSVIVLLIFAYYGVYLYVIKMRKGDVTPLARWAAWISAGCFLVIGFLFSNNMSLMTNADRWIEIFRQTNVAGAVTGLALNIGEPTLLPRWLMVLGMAVTTVGVYVVFDGAHFSRRESDAYREFAPRYGLKVYSLGCILFGAMAGWYLLGAMPKMILERIATDAWFQALLVVIAFLPVLLIGLTFIQRSRQTKFLATMIAIIQFLFLGANAIARQWVQNIEVARYFDVSTEAVHTQWSPMIVFLLLFIAGVAIVIWMVTKIVGVGKREAANHFVE